MRDPKPEIAKLSKGSGVANAASRDTGLWGGKLLG